MEKILTHEESLNLINEMIHRAQNNYQKAKVSSVFWGYAIAFIAITNSVLLHLFNHSNLTYFVWFATIPCWIVCYFIHRHDTRTSLVKSHFDKIASFVWIGYGVGLFIFIGAIFSVAYKINDFDIMFLINPVIMTMVGICEFVMGSIYRYKPWYWIAFLFWTSALACSFLTVDLQFIVLAFCMIFGFAIPGHVLNHKIKKNHV
jgi:hypothetical protein